jgi:hypothetical protein
MKSFVLSNFSLDSTARGGEALRALLEIAFAGGAAGGKATHWTMAAMTNTLALFWHEVTDATTTPFPVPLPFDMIADFVAGVLSETGPVGNPPDIDGSTTPAFRVLAGDALREVMPTGQSFYAIVAVQPVWGLIGK